MKNHLALVVVLLLAACGDPSSTGDRYIMNGSGCPDGFEYLRDGETWEGCTFDVRPEGDLTPMTLMVTCGDLKAKEVTRNESRPVWRSDEDPGLQVFWPGNRFACAKMRGQ